MLRTLWTVLDPTPVFNSPRNPRCLCRCVCGLERMVDCYSLKTGRSRGCRSCVRLKFVDPVNYVPGMVAARHCYNGYLNSARRRGLEFTLTFEEFLHATQQPCRYCGSVRQQATTLRYRGNSKASVPFEYNGLDRLENSHGYTVDNAVPCCIRCNIAKHYFPECDFLQHVKNIYEYSQLQQLSADGVLPTRVAVSGFGGNLKDIDKHVD